MMRHEDSTRKEEMTQNPPKSSNSTSHGHLNNPVIGCHVDVCDSKNDSSNKLLSDEYLTEIEWLKEQSSRVVRLNQSDDQLDNKHILSPLLPTAAFLYRSTVQSNRTKKRHRTDSPDPLPNSRSVKRPINAVLLVPCSPSSIQSSTSNQPQSISLSSSYFACFPETFRELLQSRRLDSDCKILLAVTRRLRRRYGEVESTMTNSNVLINPCQSSIQQVAPASLLLDPMEVCHLSNLMGHLQPTSAHGGAASPVSPVLLETNGQQPHGAQPVMTKRNRARNCATHSDSKHLEAQRLADLEGRQTGSWSWDKEEPLSLPGLCSCNDDHVFRIWQQELDLHRTYCAKSRDVPNHVPNHVPNRDSQGNDHIRDVPNFDLVDWDSVKKGNFNSFLKDLKINGKGVDGFNELRFCNSCGGLPYIPYSFIEISLTRDIPTLVELVKKLPLPTPTEMFCDGLRVTGTLVSRSPLHEWLILCCLQFAGLARTCRVYDICSTFIYPFHRLPDRWPSNQQTAGTPRSGTSPSGTSQNGTSQNGNTTELKPLSRPCLRHRLIHIEPPFKSLLMDPPRMVHAQQRRPYCLSLRQRVEFPSFQSTRMISRMALHNFSFNALEETCWTWLSQQTTLEKKAPSTAQSDSASHVSRPKPIEERAQIGGRVDGSIDSLIMQPIRKPAIQIKSKHSDPGLPERRHTFDSRYQSSDSGLTERRSTLSCYNRRRC